MSSMRIALTEAIAAGSLTVIDRIDLPARPERRLPIPRAFRSEAFNPFFSKFHADEAGLWRHQALALDEIAAGKNVIVATGTASGKSAVFQAATLRFITNDPDSRILVFYPLKALSSDQLQSWQDALNALGLQSHIVGMIHGGISNEQRARVLERSRIVLMTPDVCHAWFMRQISSPAHRRFISNLQLLILDEAHVLEAVFGSNVAFLLRRMQAARSLASRAGVTSPPLQIIAASATIQDATDHLEALCGVPFTLIGEDENGSPTYERSLLHIPLPPENNEAAITLLSDLSANSETGSFIAFIDSRQGVERIADRIADDKVAPYRSGYEEEDRAAIERSLRSGNLRGVISTSALELGVNIPHFEVGLNLGVPGSKKAFRQRVGRVGRNRPAVFAVLADPAAFRRLGSTFEEYWLGTVEPSHLYLENRFIQFAHARCLWDELEALGAKQPVPPANVNWPSSFRDVYNHARPGGARPREFDQVYQLGGDEPHWNYPLRNVGELSFRIRPADGDSKIGTIGLQQAIREAYPGSVYLHLAQRFRVLDWRNSAFERAIRVARTQHPPTTTPLIRTFVNAAVDQRAAVMGNYRSGTSGFICECDLQITERVEGYRDGQNTKLYRDLRQSNPGMTPKTRDFRTTGVVLQITESWIREKANKERIAAALRELMVREYSISPQDIGATATNIAFLNNGFRKPVSDAIAVYDGTYGSLRLTEPLFTNFEDLIGKFQRALDLTIERDAPLSKDNVAHLLQWFSSLSDSGGNPSQAPALTHSEFIQVLRPGSRLTMYDSQNVLREIEIVKPELFDPKSVGLEESPRLVYQYKPFGGGETGGVLRVGEQYICLTGDEWSWILWCPATGEMKEVEQPEESAS